MNRAPPSGRFAAASTGDLIRQSLYTSMLRNERDRLQEMIAAFGREPGVEAIRPYVAGKAIAEVVRERGLAVEE